MHLPRIVVLVADGIVQENSSQIVLYKDKRDHDILI